MLGRFWLRTAAIASLLLTLAHTFGFTKTQPGAQLAARRAMEAAPFDLGGSVRTYWDVYVGFGLVISALMLAQAGVLWLLARQDRRHPGEGRAFVAVLFLSNLATLGLDWRYLFAAPQIVSAVITLAIGAAFVTLGQGATQTRTATA
ncbi:LIC_13387 family protein [Phenylobacterium sp.]|jgi:hypothetical protein|uniref:LIC_13387 family protein n=1 Tax=Phenylobacterium sp. TaxID=1871053 RepID=UPI002E335445|nr:hypothetical protein [Phenylobacterium sp.]HEX3364813.1 hypothetical protein [Phenylobacterium sp.]